jgi:signal transduction histidine kinase/CheY-like chemotaxis protein
MVDSRSRTAEERVAVVIDEVHRRTLRLGGPYRALGVALATLVAWREIRRGHTTVWIVALPVAIALMALAFVLIRSTRTLAVAQCAGFAVLSTSALMHFGPLLGTGLAFALSMLAAGFFFGRAAMLLTAGYLLLLVVYAALATRTGSTQSWPATLQSSDWGRLLATAFVLLGILGLLFDTIQSSMRAAIGNEVAARIKQEEAESEHQRVLTASLTAQRLETLGELAAGVAHDINNTLAVIQGTLEALPEAPQKERAQLVEEGLVAVRSGSQTARRLLGLAQRSSEDVGSCDPGAVIDTTVKAIRRVLPEGLTVDVDIEPCPDASISAGALEQVLLNLLVNARDATAGRGRVNVRCRAEVDRVRLDVSDDGPGMSDEVRARVFEPFFTTKARGEGTGLGLSLVQRLIHRGSGTLELDTSPGHGAKFTIRFPIVARKIPTERPSVSIQTRHKGGKVLVVEDDPQVQRLLDRILKRAGYEVTVVGTVGEAKDHLEEGRYQLLITDGQLPDGNAGGVIEAYRARHATGPVIVCTGYLDDQPVISQIEKDARSVLVHKPFATEAILELAARLIREAMVT